MNLSTNGIRIYRSKMSIPRDEMAESRFYEMESIFESRWGIV